MNFKKLALAAAVAVAPMSALALEPMQDDALSAVTGQDGITIGLTTPSLTLDAVVHDNDGLAGGGNGITGDEAGAIVIDNLVLNTGGNEITAKIDADGNAGAPILNVAVTIPSGTIISTGDLYVAGSLGMGATTGTDTLATSIENRSSTAILDSMDITLGQVNMNIQLGNEVQTIAGFTDTQMIAMDTTITGGITISNFSLNDATATTGGSLSVGSIVIDGNNGGMDVVAGVNLDSTDGVVISVGQLGTTSGLSVQMTDVALGTGTSIGDVEILGLNLNGTQIAVRGH